MNLLQQVGKSGASQQADKKKNGTIRQANNPVSQETEISLTDSQNA